VSGVSGSSLISVYSKDDLIADGDGREEYHNGK
jgi:hypothetical protein